MAIGRGVYGVQTPFSLLDITATLACRMIQYLPRTPNPPHAGFEPVSLSSVVSLSDPHMSSFSQLSLCYPL